MKPALPLNAWLRYDLVWRLLRSVEPEVRSILEIGPGTGAIAARLASRFEYIGVEPDVEAHRRAVSRLGGKGRLVCGGVAALDPHLTFDMLCGFEVLEHIEDDDAALREWRQRLRVGGWLLLTAPAHQNRFGPHDVLVGHYRRYNPEKLHDLLITTGYANPIVLTCGFPFGYALELGRNTIARLAMRREMGSMQARTAASGRWLQPPDAIGWLTSAVSAPFRLAQRPFVHTSLGTGVVALARRAT
jgi:SAM-dependent methyltransferase